jgi:hypothetical protein
MSEAESATVAHPTWNIRSIEVRSPDMQAVANGIESLYNDELDVALIRGAFDASRSAA